MTIILPLQKNDYYVCTTTIFPTTTTTSYTISNSINAATPITAKNQIILDVPSKFKEWDEEFLSYARDLNFKNYLLGIEPL